MSDEEPDTAMSKAAALRARFHQQFAAGTSKETAELHLTSSADGEEDDYMSADFLQNDIRPGVHKRPCEARKHRIERAKMEAQDRKKQRKTMKEIETETREAALAKPVGEESKGFALMTKMGYKPGMGLGRNNPDAIREPVGIELKNDRTGLGHQAAVKQRATELLEQYRQAMIERKRHEGRILNDYRSRMRENNEAKLTDNDLHKLRKACFDLDSKAELEMPGRVWFWPDGAIPGLEGDAEEGEESENGTDNADNDKLNAKSIFDEDAELEPSVKLAVITAYLRESYAYCMYCGHAYTDADDLAKHCPGPLRSDHDE